jgi:hypothetical protein
MNIEADPYSHWMPGARWAMTARMFVRVYDRLLIAEPKASRSAGGDFFGQPDGAGNGWLLELDDLLGVGPKSGAHRLLEQRLVAEKASCQHYRTGFAEPVVHREGQLPEQGSRATHDLGDSGI